MRSTFISNALARGLTVFETARIAENSTRMIELHNGALLDAAHSSLFGAAGSVWGMSGARAKRKDAAFGSMPSGSDGTRTRDLRRDRPAAARAHPELTNAAIHDRTAQNALARSSG